jgi:hypothetical protein
VIVSGLAAGVLTGRLVFVEAALFHAPAEPPLGLTAAKPRWGIGREKRCLRQV